jgi:NAD(P)H-dependent FMN reductase
MFLVSTFNVLGVCGSLRKASLNHLFLRSMSLLCPDNINFSIYPNLGSIPLFNADDTDASIPRVTHWRSALANADLVMIATPEYAHGVTGVIKNALDWIVSSGELENKLVAFPNISVRAETGQSHLMQTLQVMGCQIIPACSPSATLKEPLIIPDLDEVTITKHSDIRQRLNAFWQAIYEALITNKSNKTE